MPRVAVIGGRAHAVLFARELGVDVVLVHEEDRYEPEFERACERIVHAPTTDGAAIAAALAPLHRHRPFDRILCTTDLGTVPTAEACAALGVPGTGVAAAAAIKNKPATRRVLAEHGLAPVRFARAADAAAVAAFAESHGGACVLKPADGSGSEGVHIVRTPGEAESAWASLRAQGYAEALVEEFLDGPLFTVEAFSVDGRHTTLGTSEEYPNENNVEVAIDAPSGSLGTAERAARDLTVRFLDAIGVTDGPTHTELVLTAEGPRILESHNRMAGVGIPELIRRAYGTDINRLFLGAPLGLAEPPRDAPATGGAAIRFLTPPAGRIAAIDGLDGIDAKVRRVLPGERTFGFPGLFDEFADAEAALCVQVNPGDTVAPVRTGFELTKGYAIASGPTAQEAAARCERIVESVRFRME